MINVHSSADPATSQPLTKHAWLLLVFLLFFAYCNSFIQDDAFISFRYAYNLAHGDGLVWNPGEGERVEGYTNFLWTLLMSVPIALGIDPVPASKFYGLVVFFGTLVSVYKISLSVFRSSYPALLAVFLLGTNYSFSAYATGGLETQMQCFLVTAGIYLTLRMAVHEEIRLPSRATTFSLLCAAALLTRLDSAVLFAIPYAVVFWTLLRGQASVRSRANAAACLVLPPAVIVGSWLVWKCYYYGEILPNTFHIKASHLSVEVLVNGVFYCYLFFHQYLLFPFVFLGIAFGKELFLRTEMRFLAAITVLWCLYIVSVGGDFMEFRFLIPVLPLFFVLLAGVIMVLANRRIQIALAVLALFGSLNQLVAFRYDRGIESIARLEGHVLNEDENWRGVGLALEDRFSGSAPPVSIAVMAAGAIPYYSHLPTIDMLGLNDRWVAKYGPVSGTRVGHQRRATLEYLVRRGVNLVLGHPQVEAASFVSKEVYSIEDLGRFGIEGVTAELLPAESRVIEIPLDSAYKITVLYLVENDRVNEVIEGSHLRCYEIRRGLPDS